MGKYMDYSKKVNELTRKIYYSRLRMLTNHPFFGVLALDMKYSLDSKIESFTTDGTTITFNPNFLDRLGSEEEVDICILHSIMHTILKHPFKEKDYKNKRIYNLACDIVVNSNILYSADLIGKKELVVLGQILPHKVPNGKEGYEFTTKEVYEMLMSNVVEAPKHSDKPLISYRVDFDGTLYSRKEAFIEYQKDGNWQKLASLNDIYDQRSLQLTFDKIQKYNKISKVEYNNLSKQVYLPIPSYSNHLMDNETYPKIKNYNFCFKEMTRELLDDLRKISYSNISLKEFEKTYREYVRKNYLKVPLELQNYFDKISYINNFKKDDKDIIFKVANYIKSSAKYDFNFLACLKEKDFVITFMETKIGICRHFASAATMFYRSLGIPARYTLGYSSESNKNKVNYIYEKDLHAWVEVYVDEVGWIIIDPTAASMDGNLIDSNGDGDSNIMDSHNKWKEDSSSREREVNNKILEAKELAKSRNQGTMPSFVPVLIDKLTKPQIDWRIYLANFINEVVVDYSFCPPDKRFMDSDFLLPSFSEPDEEVKDILFMVDVSGSMSEKAIVQCFSEIQSAILQFNGKLQGYVGFFDTEVKQIVKFDGDTNIKDIKPYGRGGTNFIAVFDYIGSKMKDKLPSSIIILSDGYAAFPKESKSLGIPVLWVINNDSVTPPFGNVTRIIKE